MFHILTHLSFREKGNKLTKLIMTMVKYSREQNSNILKKEPLSSPLPFWSDEPSYQSMATPKLKSREHYHSIKGGREAELIVNGYIF